MVSIRFRPATLRYRYVKTISRESSTYNRVSQGAYWLHDGSEAPDQGTVVIRSFAAPRPAYNTGVYQQRTDGGEPNCELGTILRQRAVGRSGRQQADCRTYRSILLYQRKNEFAPTRKPGIFTGRRLESDRDRRGL